jgi:hypothetical protein
MADKGVPLTGKAVYDEDLYGAGGVAGYAAVAADLEAEEEMDDREQAVARSVGNLHSCVLPCD